MAKKHAVENEPDVVMGEVLGDGVPAAVVLHDAGLVHVPQAHPLSSTEFAMASARAVRAIVMKHCKLIGNRNYIYVEAWQAIANAMGCVASASNVRREENGFSAIGEVRRMSDGVIISTGEGFVGDDEQLWARRPEYARRAMVQTRAISRACRSAFAFIAVMVDESINPTPAEEMPDYEPEARTGTPAGPGAPVAKAASPRPAPSPAGPPAPARATTPTPTAGGSASPLQTAGGPGIPPQEREATGNVNAALDAFLGKQAEPPPFEEWMRQNTAAGMVEDLTATHLRIALSNKSITDEERSLAQQFILAAKDKQKACSTMVERLQQLAGEREGVDADLAHIQPRTHAHRTVRRWAR